MKKFRIILADDHSILRDGLKSLLKQHAEWEVVGEAKGGKELLTLLKTLSCDLVILDIAMPGMDGLTALREITINFPGIKVLVLSMMNDYPHFEKAKAFGAAGFMSKEDAGDELPRAIQKIIDGKMYIAPSVTTLLVERQLHLIDTINSSSIEILTKREKQVLAMIAQGLTNRKIALDLQISIHTVENHRANLSEKLGSKNAASLVQYAIEKGLI